ncbi:polysaccharide deacetylase family protein [Geodermatophilus sp. SYSU D00684]
MAGGGPAAARTAVVAVTSELLAGQQLAVGQEIVSPSGAYRLVMQGDGHVVLYGPAAMWGSWTFVPGTVLVMQADGNLVAYAPGGRAVWHTATYGSGATRLVVQDDGNLVLYRPDGRAVWSTNTWASSDALVSGHRLGVGQSVYSRSGAYRLTMQADGHVVVYGPWGATWGSWSFVPGTVLAMQADGNLVGYAPDGRAVWHTATYGSGATRLVVQDDGDVVLVRPDWSTAWATGSRGGLPFVLRGQDLEVIPTDRRVVALTFDAGGDSSGLASILATLAGRQVPATFFLTGRWAAANPSGVAAIRSAGHRVANHSMTHPHFPASTDAAMRQELLDAERAIRAGGADPRPLFRFPFGDRTAHTIAVVNGAGYGAVRWTVDTLGWQGTSGGRSVQTVVDRALGALRPGEIVLMHVGAHPDDGSTLDAAALPTVIDRMRAAGYGFVTLDALWS